MQVEPVEPRVVARTLAASMGVGVEPSTVTAETPLPPPPEPSRKGIRPVVRVKVGKLGDLVKGKGRVIQSVEIGGEVSF
jgi:hypothetical protein